MTSPSSLPNSAISDFLAGVALAPRQAHKALSIWPLVRRADAAPPRAPAYVLLAEALAAGDAFVDEVSETGSVPHVRVANRGAQATLVMFGEALRGAKQNRIANASFLVAGHSELTIDVSCVEQGRWGRRPGAGFAAGAGLVSSALRRNVARPVHQARDAGRGFSSDQGEVWRDVRERMAYAHAESRTLDYDDYVATRRHDVEEVCGSFAAVPDQLGFVATLGDAVVGLEAIGRPEPFATAFVALLRGYAIDAVDAAFVAQSEGRRALARPRFDAPEAFLAALAAAPASGAPSPGLGTDLRLTGAGLAGCALVCDGDVVHLTAFPEAGV
jgi:hypothetical protein